MTELSLKIERVLGRGGPSSAVQRAFREALRARLLDAQIAIREGKPATLAHIAVMLRDSGEKLGASRFAQLSSDLERLGRDGKLDGGFALLRDLREEWHRYVAGPPSHEIS